MRKAGIVAACALVSSIAAPAQTLVTRVKVSDGKGLDSGPQIVDMGGGQYAIFWDRQLPGEQKMICGRVIGADGRFVTPLRKNLVGTSQNLYSDSTATRLGTDRALVAGFRSGTYVLYTRVYDAKLKPKGGMVATGLTGTYLTSAPTPAGAILCWGSWGDVGKFVPVDSSGKVVAEPIILQTSKNGDVFRPMHTAVAPSGYLIAGIEYSADMGKGRASGVYIPSALTSANKAVAYGSKFNPYEYWSDVAFAGQTGMALFGHGVDESTTAGYTRALRSDGRPSGGAKKYPPDAINYTSYYRLLALPDRNQFAGIWYQSDMGLNIVQLLSSKGAPAAGPVEVTESAWRGNGSLDMAWDSTSSRLIVAYAEYPAGATSVTEVWAAIFSVPAAR